jgi:hypothetical protein
VQFDEGFTTVQLKSQEALKGSDASGFTFDRVFGMQTRQEEVFEYGVRGIVDGELPTDRSVEECVLIVLSQMSLMDTMELCSLTDRPARCVIVYTGRRYLSY